MKNTFNGPISSMNTAEGKKNSDHEDRSVETALKLKCEEEKVIGECKIGHLKILGEFQKL